MKHLYSSQVGMLRMEEWFIALGFSKQEGITKPDSRLLAWDHMEMRIVTLLSVVTHSLIWRLFGDPSSAYGKGQT